jgi:hypothetical protein
MAWRFHAHFLATALLLSIGSNGVSAREVFGPTAQECSSLFSFGPETNTEISDPRAEYRAALSLLRDLEGYEVELLGSGVSGRVYRFRSNQGDRKSFVLKTQFSGNIGHESLDFEILRSIQTGSGVRIVRPEVDWRNVDYITQKRVAARIEDVRGTPLFQVLADPKVSFETKAKLRAKYQSFVTDMREALETRFSAKTHYVTRDARYHFVSEEARYTNANANESMTFERAVSYQPPPFVAEISVEQVPRALPGLDPESRRFLDYQKSEREPVTIILKSDNFIVTPQGELVLIDPI